MCVAKWTQTGEGHRGSVMGDFQCECDMHAALGEGVRQMKADISQGRSRHGPSNSRKEVLFPAEGWRAGNSGGEIAHLFRLLMETS